MRSPPPPPTKAFVRKAKTAATKLVRAGYLLKDKDRDGTEVYRLVALEKKYDQHTALFNCHINGADKKAKAAFITKFGKAVWNAKLADAEKNGIMVIFKSAPTKWTKFYVETVAKIVNEGRF